MEYLEKCLLGMTFDIVFFTPKWIEHMTGHGAGKEPDVMETFLKKEKKAESEQEQLLVMDIKTTLVMENQMLNT